MQEQLNLLIEKHCASIKNSVSELGDLLNKVQDAASSAPLETVREAEALAHQLKGSTGTAGFREVSGAATALDDHLKVLCRTSPENITQEMGEAMQLFGQLSAIVTAITPSSSTLYKAA